WDKELSDDLYRLAVSASTELGRRQAQALGFPADEYNVDQTLKFLRTVADKRAEMVNATTLHQLQEAIAEAEDSVEAAGHVFDNADSARSLSGAGAMAAF